MAFLHSAYDKIGLSVYVIDFDTYEIIYTNRKCIEHFGEIKGRKCYDVLNDAERCKTLLGIRCYRTGTAQAGKIQKDTFSR